MKPKVSILVPVFNVSAYIEKCAESILNQTFKDIEYVFINDGTTDDSMDKLQTILDRYPEQKDKVKIIQHATNKGSAAARNSAINASTGDYILFVDGDDYIELNMVEILFQKAKNENADIVISDILMEYTNKTTLFSDNLSINKQEHFINIITTNLASSSLCNKLISRNLYENLNCIFPIGLNYMEDHHVIIRLFYFANKIVKVDQALYHYVHYNKNSVTKNKVRMHFENVIQFWHLLDTFLIDHNEFNKYRKIVELSKVQSKVRLMIDTQSTQLRKEFANMYYEEESRCLSQFKRGEKLMLLLIRYKMFGLAQLFHNILLIKNKK